LDYDFLIPIRRLNKRETDVVAQDPDNWLIIAGFFSYSVSAASNALSLSLVYVSPPEVCKPLVKVKIILASLSVSS